MKSYDFIGNFCEFFLFYTTDLKYRDFFFRLCYSKKQNKIGKREQSMLQILLIEDDSFIE